MRFMMIVKANEQSEAGVLPTKELVGAMGRFNEAMVDAGVMLASDGLQPSSLGARVAYAGTKRVVTNGPFAEAKELIAGYWVIEVASKREALDWALRIPFEDGEVEVRQIFETVDFPAEVLPPEEVAHEQAMQEKLRAKAGR